MPKDDEESSTFDETEVWFHHWVGNDTKALPETPPYFEWAWTSPDGHRT
jgi:hypothetical protein